MTAALLPVPFEGGRARVPRLSKAPVPGFRAARYWTEDEIAILRAHYPSEGARVEARLPGRPRYAIFAKARAEGLKREGGGGKRQKYFATPTLDARIREEWAALPATRGGVAELADRCGVPRWWLTKRATALGLTKPHRKEPPWTAAEEELLARIPLHSPEVAARTFREHGFARSPSAIVNKAKRLGIARRYAGGFSATAAARLLGVDATTVSDWCVEGLIAAARRGTDRLPQQGGDAWTITPAALRRFVAGYPERVDWRRADTVALIALVLPAGAPPPAAARTRGRRRRSRGFAARLETLRGRAAR